MATESEEAQAQAAVATCKVHIKEKVFVYCKACKKCICDICFRGEHSQHEWCVLDKYAKQVRREGQQTAKRIQDEVIGPLKARKLGKRNEQEKDKIRRMQQTMKKAIDDYSDDLVAQLNGDENEEDHDKKIKDFEKMANFFSKFAQTASNNVVIEMDEELHNKLQKEASSKSMKRGPKMFQKGNFNLDSLKAMFGRLIVGEEKPEESYVEANVIKSFTYGEGTIQDIALLSGQRAWVRYYNSKHFTLIDQNGKEIENLDSGMVSNDFIVKSDEIVFTGANKNIYKLSSGKVTKMHSFSQLYLRGICQSNDNNGLLVCLAECRHTYITTTTKGEVHHIDMTGRVMKRYREDLTDHTKLFTWPCRVAQNTNSDICVADWLDKDGRSRLVVVNVDSKRRFTYTGQSSMKEEFVVTDVVCDSLGKIILLDVLNDAIHMLNSYGQFLQFLLTGEDTLYGPQSLDVYGDTMWVGNYKGIIKVCKLKKTEESDH